MVQHPRRPAVLILAFIAALAAAAWPLASRLTGHGAAPGTLDELELLITTGNADAQTWFAYGQRLAQTGRHTHAAMAFRKALELDPLHRDSRMSCATSLARSQQHDELAAYLHDLLPADAKLALDLFEDPALRSLGATPRFAALREAARLQSLD